MTVGERNFTPEERAAGLLFRLRDSLKSRDRVERGGATLVGTGTTFGASGMTLDGSGNLSYAVSGSKIFRSAFTIKATLTFGFTLNDGQFRWLCDGYNLALATSVRIYKNNSDALIVVVDGTALFSIAYATWSSAVVAGENTLVISLASGANSFWINGTLVASNATAWSGGFRFSVLAVGGAFDNTFRWAGTIRAFEIWGNAATAADEPYLRNGNLISKLDEPLIVLPGTSAWRDTTDSNKYKTEVRGKAGITSALMGSTGLVTTEFPSIVKPRGFSFDGGDSITIPDADALSFTTGSADLPFSIVGLINRTKAASDYGIVLAKGTGNTAGEWYLQIAPANIYFQLIDNTGAGRKGRVAPYTRFGVDDVIVATFGGGDPFTSCMIYVNGVRVDNGNSSSSPANYTRMRNTTDPVLVGGSSVYGLTTGRAVLPQAFDYELCPLQVKAMTARLRYQARRG